VDTLPAVEEEMERTTTTKKEKEKPPMKARKVEIFPDVEQRKTIDEWIDVARWIYNMGVSVTKEKAIPMQHEKLRAAFVNESGLAVHRCLWATKAPYEIRDGAMRDLTKAHKACREKNSARKKRGEKPEPFRFRFRCKKDHKQSILMRKSVWNKRAGTTYANIFTPLMKASEEPLPATLLHDGRLVREKVGRRSRYYYIFNQLLEPVGENQAHLDEAVCAVDPGVRCFATIYDPHRCSVVNWGDGDMKRIYSLAVQVDKLQSLWSASGVKHRRRYRLKAKAALFRSRIRSVVDETHKKLCTYLCSNYSLVLMPEFTTSEMVSRKHRKIGSHTARSMCTWAHYRFRQRLLHKVREYPSCRVVLCNEEYTSMTCGACGILHHGLGGFQAVPLSFVQMHPRQGCQRCKEYTS
jgi:putative transposase